MTFRILCYGDSNTHGTPPMADLDEMKRFDRAIRWPGAMAQELGDGFEVIEEGLPGRTTVHDDPVSGAHKNGLTVLPAILETHRPLDLVILMLGTNDLKARFAVTPFDIAESVAQLSQMSTSMGAGPDGTEPQVLMVSPVPITETAMLAEMFQGGAEKSKALASRMLAMARRGGWHFLDAGRHAKVDPLDGIHLDEAAQVAIGRAMARKVQQIAG